MTISFPQYSAVIDRLAQMGIGVYSAGALGANIYWLSNVPMGRSPYHLMSQAEILRYATTVQGPSLP
jgi:hypothetical protein